MYYSGVTCTQFDEDVFLSEGNEHLFLSDEMILVEDLDSIFLACPDITCTYDLRWMNRLSGIYGKYARWSKILLQGYLQTKIPALLRIYHLHSSPYLLLVISSCSCSSPLSAVGLVQVRVVVPE